VLEAGITRATQAIARSSPGRAKQEELIALEIDDANSRTGPALFDHVDRTTESLRRRGVQSQRCRTTPAWPIAVRGAAWSPAGRSLRRDGPLDARELVPAELVASRRCEEIAVMALLPLVGEPACAAHRSRGPIAWVQVHRRPRRCRAARLSSRRHATRVLELPPLFFFFFASWSGGPGDVISRPGGRPATPRLGSYGDATSVEDPCSRSSSISRFPGTVVAL